MAQIINITSEALQATIRRLLPSQQGFGEDLQASNVVTPIIDLTPTAEGSVLNTELQTSWDFSTTKVSVNNTTTTIVNTPGFYKVDLTAEVNAGGAATQQRVALRINDGTSTKDVWSFTCAVATGPQIAVVSQDMYVFLRSGDTLEGFSVNTDNTIDVIARQVADVNGNLSDPLGFVQQ